MNLKELLGEDLYKQVEGKVGDKKIAVVSDGNWIPKEKFNEVNLEKNELKNQVSNSEQKIADLEASFQSTNEKYADYDKNVEGLASELNTYKTQSLKTRIAMEHKIPFELAGRLTGETEDELKADAQSLSGFITQKPSLPLASTEPNVEEPHKYSNQARILEEQYKSE